MVRTTPICKGTSGTTLGGTVPETPSNVKFCFPAFFANFFFAFFDDFFPQKAQNGRLGGAKTFSLAFWPGQKSVTRIARAAGGGGGCPHLTPYTCLISNPEGPPHPLYGSLQGKEYFSAPSVPKENFALKLSPSGNTGRGSGACFLFQPVVSQVLWILQLSALRHAAAFFGCDQEWYVAGTAIPPDVPDVEVQLYQAGMYGLCLEPFLLAWHHCQNWTDDGGTNTFFLFFPLSSFGKFYVCELFLCFFFVFQFICCAFHASKLHCGDAKLKRL